MTKINDGQKKAVGKRSNDGSNREHKAFSRKNTSQTFWNLLRTNSNMRLEDVAEYTGFKVHNISAWFNGQNMPSDYNIKVLCDMFDVPYEKGKLEMENAYTIYHGTHGTINKEPRKAPKSVVMDVQKYASVKKEPEVTVQEENIIDLDGIMRLLFYELSYDEYKVIERDSEAFNNKDEILKKLFDLLSWEAYERIRAMLK